MDLHTQKIYDLAHMDEQLLQEQGMGKPKRGRKSRTTVEVPLALAESWSDFCDKHDLVSRRVVGKLLLWFVAQQPEVRTAIINQEVPVPEAIADALELLADRIRKRALPYDPDQLPSGFIAPGEHSASKQKSTGDHSTSTGNRS